MRTPFITIFMLSCTQTNSRLPDPTQVALARFDRDGSGTITADELRDPHAEQLVDWHDTDRSGAIDPDELTHLLTSDPTGMDDGSPLDAAPGPAPPPTTSDRPRPHVTGQHKKRAPRHRDP